MKTHFKIYFTFTLFLFSFTSFAEPALWQVEKNGVTSYLFGTVHVGDTSMKNLPDKVKQAIKKSDEVMVEVNISQLPPLEIQAKTLPFMMLNNGKTLKTELNAKNYEKLANYFKKKQINIDMFNTVQPWGVMLMITQMEYQNAGYSETYGIDKQVMAYAKSVNIPINELETLELQLGLFKKLTPYNNEMISDSLKQLKDMQLYFTRLINAWKQGDHQALESYYAETFKQNSFSKLSEKVLLTNRNNQWVARLTPRLNKKSLFIAVGALHLVADKGLIKQFKQHGFKVNKI